MIIYILLPVLILVLTIVYQPDNSIYPKRKIGFLFFVGILLVIVPGLRHLDVGLDTKPYYEMFIRSGQISTIAFLEESRHEPLYLVLTSIVNMMTGNFVILQLIVAITYIGGVLIMVYNYSEKVWYSCLLYFVFTFYYMSFNEMRQAMAIGIVCIAFRFIVEKKFWSFLFSVTIAGCFHFSAFIILPLYFANRIRKINIVKIGIIGGLFFLTLMTKISLMTYMNSMISIEYSENDETGGFGLLALQGLTLTLGYVLRNKIAQTPAILCMYYFIAFSLIIFPVCQLDPALFRLGQYSWIVMIVFVPNMLLCIKKGLFRLMGFLLYAMAGIPLALNMYSIHNQIIPYKFFWQ